MSTVRVSLIVAVASNGVVGKDNALPWHLPADLKYFKKVTLGKPVVMGRKTFESIGRALPGRSNIVVSRNANYSAEGVSVVSSLEQALVLAAEVAQSAGRDEVMVIGGAAIYAAALPLADRLYITEIHADVAGDAYMPEVDWTKFRQASREKLPGADPGMPDISFVVYQRIPAG